MKLSGAVAKYQTKHRAVFKSSDDILSKMWGCVRSSNGIKVLLSLLMVKTPLVDADCIRALACKALFGLSRSEKIKQVIGKLHLFNSGQLQSKWTLLKFATLQTRRLGRVNFCKDGWGFQGGKTFCASFCASLIAGSRRAFLCVDRVRLCLFVTERVLAETEWNARGVNVCFSKSLFTFVWFLLFVTWKLLWTQNNRC